MNNIHIRMIPIAFTLLLLDGVDIGLIQGDIFAEEKNVFAGGDGTEVAPYIVDTAEGLSSVRNHLDAHFKMTADIDLEVYRGGEGWKPIGNNNNKFNGAFDGNGHNIHNLFILRPKDQAIGLFGVLSETALVKDLILRDVDISGGEAVGGLAGAGGADIETVTVKGKVEGKEAVGGLLGVINNNIDLENCHFAGKVIGNQFVGGICGMTGLPFKGVYNPRINNCSVKGEVRGQKNVGGVIGANTGQILNSFFRGTTAGTEIVGGLTGGNNGIIKRSHAKGTVTGEEIAGGLSGSNKTGELLESYFAGMVAVQKSEAGGLIGHNSGTITDCYVTASIEGERKIGGLAGWNGGHIRKCYYSGSLIEGEKHIDGLVGKNEGNILHSYYDVTPSTEITGNNGIPKTKAEMMRKRTFEEWDFKEVWEISEGETYPYLKWEKND